MEDAKETKQLEKKVAYHPNGQPSIIATYYKGVPEGFRREFDEQGNVVRHAVAAVTVNKQRGIIQHLYHNLLLL